jgi:hypothetical protein
MDPEQDGSSDAGMSQKERKELARNQEGKIMGRKKRLETFCTPTVIKIKQC